MDYGRLAKGCSLSSRDNLLVISHALWRVVGQTTGVAGVSPSFHQVPAHSPAPFLSPALLQKEAAPTGFSPAVGLACAETGVSARCRLHVHRGTVLGVISVSALTGPRDLVLASLLHVL